MRQAKKNKTARGAAKQPGQKKSSKKTNAPGTGKTGGQTFRFILLLELVLIFSFVISFLIITVVKKTASPIASPNYKHLFANYGVLREFMTLPIRQDDIRDPAFEVTDPLAGEMVKFIRIGETLDTPGQVLSEDMVNVLEAGAGHPFAEGRRNRLHLRALYRQKNYPRFIEGFEKVQPDDAELKTALMGSYAASGDTEKAFELFKELLKTEKPDSLNAQLPRRMSAGFYARLDTGYWMELCKALVAANRQSDYLKIRPHIRGPQMGALFDAEFSYNSKNYERCRQLLERVKVEQFMLYKERLLLKIDTRENNHEGLMGRVDDLAAVAYYDPAAYLAFLRDVGGLMLTDGKYREALTAFERYMELREFYHRAQCSYLGLKATGVAVPDPVYWKTMWVTAWIYYGDPESLNPNKAMGYIKKCAAGPQRSYRIAADYWAVRMRAPKKAATMIEKYPFTYYYTKDREIDDTHLHSDSLEPFITMLNRETGKDFGRAIQQIKTLATYNLLAEAAAYIDWTLAAKQFKLNTVDRHMLKLVQAVIHKRRGNDALAFIGYRDTFDCYRCLRLPRFLRGLILPLKYRDPVVRYSREHKVDPVLVFALIREESFFRPDAVSPADAYGLMQLLLKTARGVALRHDLKIFKDDLFDPETNIRLGVEYLKFLLDKYDGKSYLALAAYNAGDHRVDKWLERRPDAGVDEFIEMIPFTATRNYVKNILRNYYYYTFYYGKADGSI